MMRRLAVAAVAAVALAGCSSSGGEEKGSAYSESIQPDEDVMTPVEPEPEPEVEATDLEPDVSAEVARQALRESEPVHFGPLTDTQLDDAFSTVCDTLDTGMTVEAILMASLDIYPDGAAGALIYAATTSTCPEYRTDVEDFMAKWGG